MDYNRTITQSTVFTTTWSAWEGERGIDDNRMITQRMITMITQLS